MQSNSRIEQVLNNAQQSDAQLINDVINEALKTFISGNKLNEAFKEKYGQHASVKSKYNMDSHYVYQRDDRFSYHMTKVPNSNFIAAQGPRLGTLETFIDNTAFNPHYNINHIVSLISVTAYAPHKFQDCYDYALLERKFSCDKYEFNVSRVSGDITQSMDKKQTYPVGVVESIVNVANKDKRKSLHVTTFNVPDTYMIDLSRTDKLATTPFQDLRDPNAKAHVYKIYETSLHEPVVVHCQAGVGRTGFFILMMELLKDYDKLFASRDAKIIAAKIHERLDAMRECRPGFVGTKDQFAASIRNAYILHRYGLEKKMAQTETIEPTLSMDDFANKEVKVLKLFDQGVDAPKADQQDQPLYTYNMRKRQQP